MESPWTLEKLVILAREMMGMEDRDYGKLIKEYGAILIQPHDPERVETGVEDHFKVLVDNWTAFGLCPMCENRAI